MPNAKAATNNEESPVDTLAEDLERTLTARWGPILVGEGLRLCLGYRTVGTFRQAIKSGKVPVPTFGIAGRRGKHALAKDVARWLAEQRASAGLSEDDSDG